MNTPNPLIFLSLAFILSAITINPLATDANTPKPVLDIQRNHLRPGNKYYILPVIRGRGGGLTLATTTKNTTSCQPDVVQERQEVENGLPVTFSPVNSKNGGVVRVSTDMNIKFSAATVCVKSTVWRLGKYDESVGKYFVTTSGVEGNPGSKTVANWFKIEKYEDDYKLVFCPTVCDFCKVICRDVGIYIDESGLRRLAITLNDGEPLPFRVMFKKAA